MIKKFLLFLTVCYVAALDCVFVHGEIVKKDLASPRPAQTLVKKLEQIPQVVKIPLKKVRCLVTVYWPSEDSFGLKRQTATGYTLKKGIAAVNFKKIPAGSKIKIEGWGTYLAADCGTDVNSRKAARERGLPNNVQVIDVFCESQKEANILLASRPEVTYATIIE